MSLDKDRKIETEALEERTENVTGFQDENLQVGEPLTLEDLAADVTDDSMTFTATLHFELEDIWKAIEHIDQMEASESSTEIDSETMQEITEDDEQPTEDDPANVEIDDEQPKDAQPAEAEASSDEDLNAEQLAEEQPADDDLNDDSADAPDSATPKKSQTSLLAKLKGQDKKTKKLVLTNCILLAVVLASVIGGLIAANSLVDKAKAANEAKIAEMKANAKEINLTENLYDMAANQVIEDVAVPTYTLDELYALDLREKTGFTADDLKIITRKGLVGCEEAFVKAEETYGVNSIFLMSIASLESAYGTQMFRPNNMFGYGRTGFSSKEECIMTVAKGLGTRYLPPGGSLYGGSPTLKGVNKRYAANPQWYYKVGKYMQGYYAELAAAKNGALDKFE